MKKNLVFIENILFLMRKKGIRSERQLANSMGILQQTINRILSGITPDPRISTMEEISRFFDIDISTLLNVDLTVSNAIHKAGVPYLKWQEAHRAKSFFENNSHGDAIGNPSFFNSYAVIIEEQTLPWPFTPGTTLILRTPPETVKAGDYLLVRQHRHNYLKKALLNEEEIWLGDVEEKFPAKPLTSEYEILGVVKEIHFEASEADTKLANGRASKKVNRSYQAQELMTEVFSADDH